MGSLTCASCLPRALDRLVIQQRDRSCCMTSSHAACLCPTLLHRPATAAPPRRRRRHRLLLARAAPPEPQSSLDAQLAPDDDSDREDIEVFATEAGVVEVVEADEAEVGEMRRGRGLLCGRWVGWEAGLTYRIHSSFNLLQIDLFGESTRGNLHFASDDEDYHHEHQQHQQPTPAPQPTPTPHRHQQQQAEAATAAAAAAAAATGGPSKGQAPRRRRHIDEVLGLGDAERILTMPWAELRSRTQELLGELGVRSAGPRGLYLPASLIVCLTLSAAACGAWFESAFVIATAHSCVSV